MFLHDIGFALGEERLTVKASVDAGRTVSSASALLEAGFEHHHVCSRGTSTLDLARRAVEDMDGAHADASAILFATTLPCNANSGSRESFERSRDVKNLMDFPASHLQADLGLDDAFVVGISQQACTGLLGTVRVARALLAAESDLERVLCVTADRFPEGALYEQAYNLISDGASGFVVSRERRGFRILVCHQITNGSLARASDDETAGAYFAYTHRLIHDTLERAGRDLSEVDWIVPQNTNRTAWQVMARLLGIDQERVQQGTLGDVAHVIGGDNAINLAHLVDRGALENGQLVLLVMAGFGMNWQAVLLERVER